jgi:hypothetical protein
MTEFENLVWHMRAAQKVYFKYKSKDALRAARRLEKDVDELLDDLQEPRTEPSLFDRFEREKKPCHDE